MMFIFFLFLYCSTIQLYSMDPQHPGITIHINNANTNQPQTQVRSQVEAQSHAQATNHTNVFQQLHNNIEWFHAFIQQQGINQYPEQLSTYAHINRYYIIGIGFTSLYVALCYQLYKATKLLNQDTFWSQWHQEIPLSELLRKESESTTEELLLAIQIKYTNAKNPTDFLLPLVTFYNEIQKEIDDLAYYNWFYRKYKRCYLTSCIPFSIQILNTLQERIDRAVYLQTVFKNWAAHYNVHHQIEFPITSRRRMLP